MDADYLPFHPNPTRPAFVPPPGVDVVGEPARPPNVVPVTD